MIDKPDFVEMSGDLPSGWEERTSRSTGQTYFLNQVDNHLHFLAIATLDSYSCSSQNSRHGTGQLSQPQRLQPRYEKLNCASLGKTSCAFERCGAPIFW